MEKICKNIVKQKKSQKFKKNLFYIKKDKQNLK
jgi:hypothetical protein